MKKRSLWLITTLMTIALLGVFVMQLYYIKEAYNLKSQLFEQNVNEALNDVVNKVQKRYAANHINKKDFEIRRGREQDFRNRAQVIVNFKEAYKDREAKRKREQQKMVIADLNVRDSIVRGTFIDPKLISEETYQTISNINTKPSSSPLKLRVDYREDSLGNVMGTINQSITPNNAPTFSLEPSNLPDSIRYIAFNPMTMRPITVTLERVTADMALKFRIDDRVARRQYVEGLNALMGDTLMLESSNLDYLKDVEMEMRAVNVPIDKRIPKDDLDTLLKKEFLNRNISIGYEFWLKLANKDSLFYRQAANGIEQIIPKNTYKIPLFGNDIFRDPGMLFVNFSNKNSLIIGNMWFTMASSAALLLVLVFIFAYTIYAIIRQ